MTHRIHGNALSLFQDGERFPRRGYWGDILVSPYISFGLESEDKSLLKTANKLHVHVSRARHVGRVTRCVTDGVSGHVSRRHGN